MPNRSHFSQICAVFGLGRLVAPPQPIVGGSLHRVWRLVTTEGTFAVKQLNPLVMRGAEARENYQRSEEVARAFARQGFPALVALSYDGEVLYDLAGMSFLLFPWAEGVTLTEHDLGPQHCYHIGRLLGLLHTHQPQPTMLDLPPQRHSIIAEADWCRLIERGLACGVAWAEVLQQHVAELLRWGALYEKAAEILSRRSVVGHGDCNPKNVLWQAGNRPLLLDWEMAGCLHPAQELLDVALSWSGLQEGHADRRRFAAVVVGYRTLVPDMPVHLEAAIMGCIGARLRWLELNLRRSLDDDSSEAERSIALRAVGSELRALRLLAAYPQQWISWTRQSYATPATEQEGVA